MVTPRPASTRLYGGSGNDVLYGGDGCDIAVNPSGTAWSPPAGTAATGAERPRGRLRQQHPLQRHCGANENTLIGGSGLDRLFAGATSGDYLEAGSGVDSLYGGTGNDVFQLPFIPAAGGQPNTTPDT